MKRLAITCFCLLTVWVTSTPCLHGAAATLPNMVIFISDDHTLRDSSVYGSKDIVTPHMDKLAAEGLTFDRAFAPSPSCAPSRGALLTGLMPARNGAEPNHAEPRANIKKLPAYLQELGYEVVAFGKVGHYNQTAHYGFDHFEHTDYHEDIAIPAALEWLRNRKSSKPLCLFVGSNWPHVPWPIGSEGHKPVTLTLPANHVETPVTRRERGRYYAAISRMDADLGMVYQLAQDKFGTNLFFLHFSDQGAQWPFGKWCLYDDGLRTPMIAVWPGKTAPGTRTKAMVSLVDVLPTLVEVAGGRAPDVLDGRSFAAVLLGKTNKFRDYIFATHSGDGNMNVYPSRSVRDTRWKYILNLHPEFKFTSHVTEVSNNDGTYWNSWVQKASRDPEAASKVHRYQQRPREELYDIETDPWEQHNVADAPASAEVLVRMRGLVERWMKEQGDEAKVYGTPTLLNAPTPAKEQQL
ncbi:MAG TPA: sulfatase [Candidatus Sulfotelmatobacter sp.]|nr:sulfatase [Candidatus Sulfotelmatobacter sp.]